MTAKTKRAVIVAEALHKGGAEDVAALTREISGMIANRFGVAGQTQLLLSPDAFYASENAGDGGHVG